MRCSYQSAIAGSRKPILSSVFVSATLSESSRELCIFKVRTPRVVKNRELKAMSGIAGYMEENLVRYMHHFSLHCNKYVSIRKSLFIAYKDICNICTARFLCESASMYKGITEL